MNSFFSKIKKHKEQKLPFVIYSKPNSNRIVTLLQQDDTLHKVIDYTEKGFVFASFDKKKMILIPESQSQIFSFEIEKNDFDAIKMGDFNFDEKAKIHFKNLVSKGIQSIKKGDLKKVVLSRNEIVELVEFDFINTFNLLKESYPNTFVFCFYHPKIGFWMGATPEQLLKTNRNVFETIALAGTQKANSETDVFWSQKEKDEQQCVTDFIIKKLQKVALSVDFTAPYNTKAGSIWHIKTDISGVLNNPLALKKVVNRLHPTPAVCGLPKKKAKTFILENENYDRTFYTGFLGELNCSFALNKNSSDLFVNLRSMQILDKKAILYMGCGITKESIPEKEWEESVNKSITMKSVLMIK